MRTHVREIIILILLVTLPTKALLAQPQGPGSTAGAGVGGIPDGKEPLGNPGHPANMYSADPNLGKKYLQGGESTHTGETIFGSSSSWSSTPPSSATRTPRRSHSIDSTTGQTVSASEGGTHSSASSQMQQAIPTQVIPAGIVSDGTRSDHGDAPRGHYPN